MMGKSGGIASDKPIIPREMASKDAKALIREQEQSKKTIPLEGDEFEDF